MTIIIIVTLQKVSTTMADEESENDSLDGEIEAEFILSLCWDDGYLSASYYNLMTLELHVGCFIKIRRTSKFLLL